MTSWARTIDGWAANLDGSDAATRFSLPRLELHSSARGWECVCLLAQGRSHQPRGPVGSAPAAKRTLVEEARALLGPEYAPVLDELAKRC
jgi:hypothetical protein